MFKPLYLSSVLVMSLSIFIYPTEKQNTKLFDYCYAFEKKLIINSTKTRKKLSKRVKSIPNDLVRFGVSKTRGNLVDNTIEQYKNSRNSFLIGIVPNEIYCLGGYWIEHIMPGKFESIFYQKSKERINKFNDMKDEIDGLLKDLNSKYKTLKKDLM